MERVAAIVSSEAYKAPNDRARTIMNVWVYDSIVSDDVIAVYVNETTRTVLVGFRGTTITPKDLSLLWGLLTNVTGLQKHAIADSERTVLRARSRHPTKKFVLTGHSKGAWLAKSFARTESDEVIGFSPATTVSDIVDSWKPRVGPQPKVVFHSVAGDVLSIPSYFLKGVEQNVQVNASLAGTIFGGIFGAFQAHKLSHFT